MFVGADEEVDADADADADVDVDVDGDVVGEVVGEVVGDVVGDVVVARVAGDEYVLAGGDEYGAELTDDDALGDAD